MSDIDEDRVYLSNRVLADIERLWVRTSPGWVRRMIREAKRIDFVEAVALTDDDLDDRNFYMLTRLGRSLLGIRKNYTDDGHTLESFHLVRGNR